MGKAQEKIIIRGLRQNNLKNISLEIPKEKIVVFTGVSGSGKSSIVFDTVAAESQRQMNETYTAFMRGRLPKYEKPKVDYIDNLTASVIIDQSRLGGNSRSTVGTISDLYATLRLLYSRIGTPWAGTASYFSFNDPNGMCKECSGIGKVMKVDILDRIDPEKSWNEGMADLPAFHVGNWYWKQYAQSGLIPLDKKYKDYTEEERNILLHGSREKNGEKLSKKVEGIEDYMQRMLFRRDASEVKDASLKRLMQYVQEKTCPCCGGRRLNDRTLSCKVAGYNIYEMCEMEFVKLRDVLLTIEDKRAATMVEALVAALTRMIDIGLPYLSMNRESSTLSGGEAQRLKLVRYMGSSLTGMTYIFDEPTTGLHASDITNIMQLLEKLVKKGNTVIVIEHNLDVMKQADYLIDIGPDGGSGGERVVFTGTPQEMIDHADTITAKYLRRDVEEGEQYITTVQ